MKTIRHRELVNRWLQPELLFIHEQLETRGLLLNTMSTDALAPNHMANSTLSAD